MAVGVTSIPPAPPPPPSHQPSVVACSTEKDRLPKLKEVVKTDLHTYQLYKVIGEGGYGTVYESETYDGLVEFLAIKFRVLFLIPFFVLRHYNFHISSGYQPSFPCVN